MKLQQCMLFRRSKCLPFGACMWKWLHHVYNISQINWINGTSSSLQINWLYFHVMVKSNFLVQPSHKLNLPADTSDTHVHTRQPLGRRQSCIQKKRLDFCCETLTKPLSGTHTLQTLRYEHTGLSADEHSLEGNGNTRAHYLSHLPLPDKSQQRIHTWINNFSQNQPRQAEEMSAFVSKVTRRTQGIWCLHVCTSPFNALRYFKVKRVF